MILLKNPVVIFCFMFYRRATDGLELGGVMYLLYSGESNNR